MERAVGEYEVDTVFHLAAQTIVGDGQPLAALDLRDEHRGTWTLLEACRAARRRSAIVVAASDKAYGAHDELPYREDFALQPRFPYDVSKAATDLIARSYWHTFGLPVAVTRFANLYGGGDLNRSRLIPEAVAAALAGRAPGDPLRRLARARLPLRRGRRRPPTWRSPTRSTRGTARGEAFNAGGGRAAQRARGRRARLPVAGQPTSTPDVRGTGTPARARSTASTSTRPSCATLTGWAPEVDLEEGLRRTVDWYRYHPEALTR